jgi:hypothetical protein
MNVVNQEGSPAYNYLQELAHKNIIEIRTKKNFTSEFGTWLYWVCKTKPSIWNLFGFLFYPYLIFYYSLSFAFIWLPLLFIIMKFSWWYWLLSFLIGITVVPLFIKRVIDAVGQGFIIFDALQNEELFDDLWQNNFIGILGKETYISPGTGIATPKIIINSPHDWREEIFELEKS